MKKMFNDISDKSNKNIAHDSVLHRLDFLVIFKIEGIRM